MIQFKQSEHVMGCECAGASHYPFGITDTTKTILNVNILFLWKTPEFTEASHTIKGVNKIKEEQT